MSADQTTRDEAIAEVLVALISPLYLLAAPSRERTYALVDTHNITARDLLDRRLSRARGNRT